MRANQIAAFLLIAFLAYVRITCDVPSVIIYGYQIVDMYRTTDESELQISNAFAQMRFPSIKPEQLQVVRGILQRDLFAVLPTGFGKSACYQCLPCAHTRYILSTCTYTFLARKIGKMLCCYVFMELRQEMFQVLGRAECRCSPTARSCARTRYILSTPTLLYKEIGKNALLLRLG